MTKKITLVISVVGTSTIEVEVDADWYREQKRRRDMEYELERDVEWCPFKVTITEPNGTTIRWGWRSR